MKAISIRQPWAWLIVNGYKTIENRSWPTKTRDEVLIHASKLLTKASYNAVKQLIQSDPRIAHVADVLPPVTELATGGIVGIVQITGCVPTSNDPWFLNTGYGFELARGRPLPFVPCKGKLSFFEVPWEQEISRQYSLDLRR